MFLVVILTVFPKNCRVAVKFIIMFRVVQQTLVGVFFLWGGGGGWENGLLGGWNFVSKLVEFNKKRLL